jgi:hypothetical protein
VTVTVCPATVSDPLRAAPVFAPTENSTVPGPVPLAPDVTLSQDVVVVAVQAQPAVVVTVTAGPAPPAAPMLAVVGATVKAHPAAPAA